MSHFNAPSYDIPKTSGHCSASGRALEPGEVYFAALVELTEEQTPESKAASDAALELGFRRIDISKTAWEGGYRPDHLFCHWKTIVPEPSSKKRLFVDDTALMNLLRRLADTDEPPRLAFRYVLALILMRKKLLRYYGTVTREVTVGGERVQQDWWQLVPKLDLSKGHLGKWSEDEHIEVLDPKLDEPRIEQVTQQIGEILEAEF